MRRMMSHATSCVNIGMMIGMNERRRPIERTRQYDIWAEHRSSKLGPYELVLQIVDELSGDGTYMLRAGYRKDGVMRPSQPTFEPARWVEALEQAIADPECFTIEQVERLAAACAQRSAST